MDIGDIKGGVWCHGALLKLVTLVKCDSYFGNVLYGNECTNSSKIKESIWLSTGLGGGGGILQNC